jgi:hypothetical protein
MTVQHDRWPNDQDDAAGSPSTKALVDARRALVLCATAILMVLAWELYLAWSQPLSSRNHLLRGLLFLLLAVQPAVSRQGRVSLVVSMAKSRSRRKAAAVLPLLVLVLIGWSQFMSVRQREAERQLAVKREHWKWDVEGQRNRVELAEHRAREAAEKGKKASEALQKAWKEERTADGKLHFHADSSAMQRWKEAFDEVSRTTKDSIEEHQRLFQLERQRPER